MPKFWPCLGALLMSAITLPGLSQTVPLRDDFFWLGEINKASAVINTEEGLLDRAIAPRIAAGPFRVIRADLVGTHHVRAIVAGADGRSLKAMAFRQADTALGQALLGAGSTRRLWLAGRAKVDDWSGRDVAELHVEDAAWAD